MPYKDKEVRRLKNQEYQRKHYQNNSQYYKDKAKAKKKEGKDELFKIKSELKCVLCPENHPAALDFHHVDSTTKDFNVGSALARGWTIKRIKAEIDKCVVLCSNCHRRHHYNENNGLPTELNTK